MSEAMAVGAPYRCLWRMERNSDVRSGWETSKGEQVCRMSCNAPIKWQLRVVSNLNASAPAEILFFNGLDNLRWQQYA